VTCWLRALRVSGPILAALVCGRIGLGQEQAGELAVVRKQVFEHPIRHVFGGAGNPQGVVVGDAILWLAPDWSVADSTPLGEYDYVQSSPNGDYYVALRHGQEWPERATLFRRPAQPVCELPPDLRFFVSDDGQAVFGVSDKPRRPPTVNTYWQPPDCVYSWRGLHGGQEGAVLVGEVQHRLLLAAGPDYLEVLDAEQSRHVSSRLPLPQAWGGAGVLQFCPLSVKQAALATNHLVEGERATQIAIVSADGDVVRTRQFMGQAASYPFALAASAAADRLWVAFARPEYSLTCLNTSLEVIWSNPSTAFAPPEWQSTPKDMGLALLAVSDLGFGALSLGPMGGPNEGDAAFAVVSPSGSVLGRLRYDRQWSEGVSAPMLAASFAEDGGQLNIAAGRALLALQTGPSTSRGENADRDQ